MSDKPRAFNSEQRAELFLRQDGRCADCGTELGPDWEADHDIPYAAGGATEVWNGRALCRPCNRKKGPRSSLREWQRDALDAYFRSDGKDFLLVATPGAGKTRVASEIAGRRRGAIQRIVVVVPTTYLKRQWADAFHASGIDLSPGFANRTLTYSADYQGVAVTYAQVAEAPDTFRRLMEDRASFVVLDEIHHCADNRSWGDAMRVAFAGAHYRLLLSGTPFRSDNNAIPFVRYVDGAGVADFNFGYADALAAGIVRAIYFPLKGSNARWISGRGEIREASFDDELDEQAASERLRTVIQADGDWFTGVIAEAHRQLMALREEAPDAAGLIIASDQAHAQKIAQTMARVIGLTPVVAISDDRDAENAIRRFAGNPDPWIVAVKMVSEGIDIPRLRVGVYATNVRAELFFNQAVGRIIRKTSDEDESAWFYLPADPVLSELARRIELDREHILVELAERDLDPDTADDRPSTLFTPIASSFEEGGTVAGDLVLTESELRAADVIRARHPQTAGLSREAVALVLRNAGPSPAAPTAPPAQPPVYTQAEKLRRVNKRLVGRIAALRNLSHREVNLALNREIGVWRIERMTVEQLDRRRLLAERWLADDD